MKYLDVLIFESQFFGTGIDNDKYIEKHIT